MNALRRLKVVAGVIATSAAAGAGAGIVVAGVVLATQFGHVQSGTAWELVKLGSQTGAALGVLLGPPMIFGLLRRVPLNRLGRDVLLGATYGSIVGFALSMAFPQPRPAVPLIVVGGLVGFGFAAMRLWARFRGVRNAAVASGAT